MRKYKMLIIGVVLGSVITISSNASAAVSNYVSVLMDNSISFKFDGQRKALSEEYTVLLYNGRTYVPARFIAEELNATVSWDEATRTVGIEREKQLEPAPILPEVEEKDKEKEEKEIPSKEKEKANIKYEKLPVTKYYNDMTITATAVAKNTDGTRVYITIENKKETPLRIVQSQSRAIVEQTEYAASKMSSSTFDTRWYSDIREDEIVEGYITVPTIPEETKEMQLFFTVFKNNEKQERIEVEINLTF